MLGLQGLMPWRCQYMPDVLPPSVLRELSRLQDDMERFPRETCWVSRG